MPLDIRVNGVSLELFPDEDKNFYITKQLHDIRDLETRNASFTKEISVPNVESNSVILRSYLPEFSRQSPDPIQFLPVDVLMEGMPIIENARLYSAQFNRTTNEIAITIFGGDQDFFNQLTDEPISDLFDEEIPWNLGDLIADGLNASFWLYPNQTWYDNFSYDKFLIRNTIGYDQYEGCTDVEMSGILIYAKEIWQRIMSKLVGITANEDWFNDLFSNLMLAAPAYQFLESYETITGIASSVSNAPGTPVSTIEKVKFATLDTDPTGMWNGTPDFKWIVGAQSGLGRLNIFMKVECFPQSNSDKDINYIRLYVNGNVAESWVIAVDANITLTTTINESYVSFFETGDEIWLEADTATAVFGPNKFTYVDDQFQLIFGLSADTVQIADICPEIGQKDFVKSILNQMHLLPTTINKVVYFEFWDNIVNNSPNLLTDKVAVNKDIIGLNRFSNYAQNNWFVYAENKDVSRNDMDTSIPVLNETLPLNVTKIELPYSASDDSIIPTLEGAPLVGKASIPAFKFDYQEIKDNDINVKNNQTAFDTDEGNNIKAGDIVVINKSGVHRMRVLAMTSTTEGNFKYPWTWGTGKENWQLFHYETNEVQIHLVDRILVENQQLVTGDGAVPSTLGAYSGGFTDRQKWVNLIDDYYFEFSKSIEKPWAITVFVYLTVAEFKNITSLNPIWLSEVGDYFYLNKIEQYRPNQLTRIELLKLYSEPI